MSQEACPPGCFCMQGATTQQQRQGMTVCWEACIGCFGSLGSRAASAEQNTQDETWQWPQAFSPPDPAVARHIAACQVQSLGGRRRRAGIDAGQERCAVPPDPPWGWHAVPPSPPTTRGKAIDLYFVLLCHRLILICPAPAPSLQLLLEVGLVLAIAGFHRPSIHQ